MAHYSLVASSTLFLGPSAYGLYRGHRMLPAVSILTMAAGVMYWLDPQSKEKKVFDIIVSKSAVMIYLVYGWKYIKSPSIRMCGYMNLVGILTAYHTSCSFYPSPYWIPCHMIFHYMSALGKLLVIHST
jgi:hypothetical protein